MLKTVCFLLCMSVTVNSKIFSYRPSKNNQHGGGYKQNHYKEERQPYKFEYAVRDDYWGTNFGHKESSDGGLVSGYYTVLLPDGRTQHVVYQADPYGGYHAEVSYDGEAQYPHPDTYKSQGPGHGSSGNVGGYGTSGVSGSYHDHSQHRGSKGHKLSKGYKGFGSFGGHSTLTSKGHQNQLGSSGVHGGHSSSNIYNGQSSRGGHNGLGSGNLHASLGSNGYSSYDNHKHGISNGFKKISNHGSHGFVGGGYSSPSYSNPHGNKKHIGKTNSIGNAYVSPKYKPFKKSNGLHGKGSYTPPKYNPHHKSKNNIFSLPKHQKHQRIAANVYGPPKHNNHLHGSHGHSPITSSYSIPKSQNQGLYKYKAPKSSYGPPKFKK